MKVLGVITARGGSKSIPRKNLQLLGGIPLIAYTILAARNSTRLTRTIVSTDDEEIAQVSRNWGAEVPFIRPAHLATDNALSIDVAIHALLTVEEIDPSVKYDALFLLQPTTPFRLPEDIDAAIEKLESTGADSVIGVVEVGGHHPARMKYLDGDRLIDPPFAEAYENQPRQELLPIYRRCGSIFLSRREVILKRSFKGSDSRGLIIPVERAIDIDNWFDFTIAECLLHKFDQELRFFSEQAYSHS